MKENLSRPSREDVLNALAVEPNPSGDTLNRYVRNYPEYAAELKELSRELLQPAIENTGPLSANDKALIEAAWKKHQAAAPAPCVDPFASLTVSGLREIAKLLGGRRQMVSAFRERRVIPSSVPRPILARLASALGISVPHFNDYLKLPATLEAGFSYKADEKPSVPKRVTFEQLLIEAGIPEAERIKLMASE